MPIPRKVGIAKPASSGFWMTGHTVNHTFRSSKPPISNRVVALNSFVLLAREVVSVLLFLRVYALMVTIVDQLPALYSDAKGYETEAIHIYSATHQEDASRKKLCRLQRLISMNICQHFCGVICAAFSSNCIKHTQKLAAHSDDRLLFLKRIGFSGGIVVMQLSKLRIASYQR